MSNKTQIKHSRKLSDNVVSLHHGHGGKANSLFQTRKSSSHQSRVSFRGETGDSTSHHHRESGLFEGCHIDHHFDISQWPTTDPLVSKLRSSIKLGSIHSDFTASEGCFGHLKNCCIKKKPIYGVIEGPLVKIDSQIFPVDYFATYQGSIRSQSTAIMGLDGTTSYTYEELNCASDHMAVAIKGIVEGELRNHHKRFATLLKEDPNYEPNIGLAISPCEKGVIAILAIWKLGLPYLPIRTDQSPVQRISAIIAATQPIIVIGSLQNKILQEAVKNRATVAGFEKICEEVLGKKKERLMGKRPFKKDERETVLAIKELEAYYTRGKHRPEQKCCAMLHRFNGQGKVTKTFIHCATIWNRVHAEWSSFPYLKNEIVCLYSSLDSHQFLGQLVTPLLAGMQIVVLDVHNFYEFLDRIQKSQIRRLMVFPELLRALVTVMELGTNQKSVCPPLCEIHEIPNFLDTVNYWFCTGAALRRELAVSFFTFAPKNARLINVFGCMETLSFVCFEEYTSIKEVKHGNYYDIIPMGRPVMNTRVYILNCDGTITDYSGLGEIYVSGLGVTKLSDHMASFTDIHHHYGPCSTRNIHLAKEESEKREDESIFMYRTLLRTTDFGRLVYSGKREGIGSCFERKVTLEFSGTMESEMIIENYRVNVAEIITYIKAFPGVKSCHVMVYRPGTPSQEILAFVVFGQKSHAIREQLHVHLRNRIPEYMMPTIVIVSGIPVKNFKVDGSLLIERFQKEKRLVHGTQASQFQSHENISRKKNSIEYKAAKIMFRIFYHVCGVGEDWSAPHLNWTLAELHVPFTSLPEILKQLRKHGYYIDIKDLCEVKTSKALLNLMLKYYPVPVPTATMFQHETIMASHKTEILNFFLHGNCGIHYIHSIAYYCGMREKDVELLIKAVWPLIVEQPYSILVRNKNTKKIVAALLNVDHRDKCYSTQWEEVVNEHPTKYRLEIIDQIDESLTTRGLINEKRANNALQTIYFLSDPAIFGNYEELVQTIQLLFNQILSLAKTAGFCSFYIIIFDYVVAHMVEEFFKFEVLEYIQVNMFTAKDGTKPFHLAPDSIIGTLLYKSL